MTKYKLQKNLTLKEIQTIVTTETVLSLFDNKFPIEIQVDASSHCLGESLMQNKHLISYSSWSLTNAEKNYAQIQKELLALAYASEKLNQFIYGQTVLTKSDH